MPLAKKRTSTAAKPKVKRASGAAGSYRGFSVQATRLLHYLMVAAPPDVVCLEVLDDVSVEKSDGTQTAEQDKSYQSANPLADRSVAFWKTLRNWVDAVARGDFDPKRTQFIMYTPGAKPGTLAKAVHEANDAVAVRDAINALADVFAALREADAEWRTHALVVTGARETSLPDIIRNLRIEHRATNPHGTLRPLFTAKLISDEALEDTIKWSHGWVKERVDALLQIGQPARIIQSDFQNGLLNYVKLHDRLVVLRSFAGTPDEDDLNSELAFRCYVRQLRIIDMDDVDVLAAINDYLRAAIDRTEWSNRGFINEAALETFQTELIAMWRNKRNRAFLVNAERQPEHQGQLLYSECIEHQLALDGLNTPDAFLRGSLHALSEDREIGWHPNYGDVLDRSAGTSEVQPK